MQISLKSYSGGKNFEQQQQQQLLQRNICVTQRQIFMGKKIKVKK